MASAALVCIVPDGTGPTDGTLARSPVQQTIEWPAGDAGTVHVTCYGEDGAIFDLAGCSIALVCRLVSGYDAYVFAVNGTIDPTPQGGSAPGTARFAVPGAATQDMVAGKTYWYDVRLVDGNNAYHVVPASKWMPTMTIARADEPPAP
jgi:hypothetical protein